MHDEALGRFRLLASAIAGRLVEVAPADPGDGTWTDGATVFVEPETAPQEQLRSIAVQASLLASGSLEPDVVGRLPRRAKAARRYLAVEGHRALAAHETLLPPSVRVLVDHATAARSDSPETSLALATSREEIAEPPAVFGSIRPKAMRTGSGLEEMGVEIRPPFP